MIVETDVHSNKSKVIESYTYQKRSHISFNDLESSYRFLIITQKESAA